MVVTDFLSTPITVGSTVVYAANHARAEVLRKGVVVAVTPRLRIRALIPPWDRALPVIPRTVTVSSGMRVVVFPGALTEEEKASLSASRRTVRNRNRAGLGRSPSGLNDEALAWLRRQLEGLGETENTGPGHEQGGSG